MSIKNAIFRLLHFFYNLFFKKYISYEVFSYLVIGIFNTVYNVITFHVLYYYIFFPLTQKKYLPAFIHPHSASLISAFIITVPLAFYLTRTFTFRNGISSTQKQFFKYLYVLTQGLLLEYLIVRFFVELLHWEATLSKITASGIVAFLNFFLQRYFTFNRKKIL